jgi:hypothetical protein
MHLSNGPGVLGSAEGGFGIVAVSSGNYGLFSEGTKGAAFARKCGDRWGYYDRQYNKRHKYNTSVGTSYAAILQSDHAEVT